jgi:hypothetical protein
MMKKATIVVTVLVWMALTTAGSGFYRPLTVEELITQAQIIVHGKVLKTKLIAEKNSWLTKQHEIEVVEVLFGKLTGKTVPVVTCTVSPEEELEDMPTEMPEPGKEVMLFLITGKDGILQPVDHFDSIWPWKSGNVVMYRRPDPDTLRQTIQKIKK